MFSGKVTDKIAFMGHSMGGGAAFLAGSGYGEATTIIGLAPAETNPPASSAAKLITRPSLILSGSQDGVTPASAHHLPIFDNLGSSCKYFISLTGGGHCFFACYNTPCDLSERLVSSNITITRETQQAISLEYLRNWLDAYLKDNVASKSVFIGLMKSDTRITYRETCSMSVNPESDSATGGFSVYPNPAGDVLNVTRPASDIPLEWRITTLSGGLVDKGSLGRHGNSIKTGFMAGGTYVVTLVSGSEEFHFRVIVRH
jgi:hypothetical protein